MSKFKESLYVLVNVKEKRENVDTFFTLFPERLVTGLDVLSIFHYTERDVLQMEGQPSLSKFAKLRLFHQVLGFEL